LNPGAIAQLELLGKLKTKINALMGNRTRDFPTCSIEPQPRYILKVFQNSVLKRIFQPKAVEVAGGCGKLLNEEIKISCALKQLN
jgi:hypothetical protein